MNSRIHLNIGDHQIEYIRNRRGCISAIVRALLDGAYYAGELDHLASMTEAVAAEHIEILLKGGKHRGRNTRTKATAPNGASPR